jgi:hypothetical protein
MAAGCFFLPRCEIKYLQTKRQYRYDNRCHLSLKYQVLRGNTMRHHLAKGYKNSVHDAQLLQSPGKSSQCQYMYAFRHPSLSTSPQLSGLGCSWPKENKSTPLP